MLYCCVIDVVTRQLPSQKKVKYPQERARLLELMTEDQQERSSSRFFSNDPKIAAQTTSREVARINEVLAILKRIKTPSARNVGLDGSRAIWLIALHNFNYKNAGKIVLDKMRRLYYRDKRQVFYPGIPFLADRLMVTSSQPIDAESKQLYGTQGLSIKLQDGAMGSKPFPIIDFKNLINRQRKFGLRPRTPCPHRP